MRKLVKYFLEELFDENECPECASALANSGVRMLDAQRFYCTNKECSASIMRDGRTGTYSISLYKEEE